jgi:hypothetical protein
MFRLVTLLVALLSLGCGARPTVDFDQFAPDNDLWQYDNPYLENASIDEALFNEIIKAGKDAYKFEAANAKEELIINALWTDKTVNANACRGCKPGQAIVNMYGGLARRSEILPESFALVLCHELGHLYGGSPYISPEYKMAAEGQSDYWATNACFDKIYARVPGLRTTHEAYQPYTENCGDNRRCKNSLEGGQGLGNLLAFLTGANELPKYETPDTTVVSKTELSYPKTVQCRLDTYGAGTLMKPRPACWYKKGSADFRW